VGSSSERQFVHAVFVLSVFHAEITIKGFYKVSMCKMPSFKYIDKNTQYSRLICDIKTYNMRI